MLQWQQWHNYSYAHALDALGMAMVALLMHQSLLMQLGIIIFADHDQA
jgi:hypothetical protein